MYLKFVKLDFHINWLLILKTSNLLWIHPDLAYNFWKISSYLCYQLFEIEEQASCHGFIFPNTSKIDEKQEYDSQKAKNIWNRIADKNLIFNLF